MKEVKDGIELVFEGKHPPKTNVFDKVLVAVGRVPNSGDLNLDKAGVEIDERGFIKVDDQLKTTAQRIYAIGDVVGNPMLAHKASHEAHVVVDVLAGKGRRLRAAGDSRGGIHRPGDRLGQATRSRRRRPPGSNILLRSSPGPRQVGQWLWVALTASPSWFARRK